MIYAPVIIPTLCRAEKFKNCIESLKKNPYAKYTELYISLDYPPSEKYRKGYQEIEQYLEAGIDGFANVIILKQRENQGSYGNYQVLKKRVYEKHDCYIFSEDDNIFSPDFLEYMDKCLTEFEKDEKILAVTGYSYPIDWQTDKYSVLKINSYFAAWGFGIWRDKEEEMLKHLSLENFERILKDLVITKKLYNISRNQYCNFIKGMIEYTDMLIVNNEIPAVDLSFSLYQIFYNKYMIFPVESKVRNTGYGQDGVHCGEMIIQEHIAPNHRNYPYDKQPIDLEDKFEKIIVSHEGECEQWNKLMDDFFTVSNREIIASRIVQIVCKLLGRNRVAELLRKVRKV